MKLDQPGFQSQPRSRGRPVDQVDGRWKLWFSPTWVCNYFTPNSVQDQPRYFISLVKISLTLTKQPFFTDMLLVNTTKCGHLIQIVQCVFIYVFSVQKLLNSIFHVKPRHDYFQSQLHSARLCDINFSNAEHTLKIICPFRSEAILSPCDPCSSKKRDGSEAWENAAKWRFLRHLGQRMGGGQVSGQWQRKP